MYAPSFTVNCAPCIRVAKAVAGLLKKTCYIGTELLITFRIVILSGYLPCYHKSVMDAGNFDVTKLKEYGRPQHCPFVQYSARLGLWVSLLLRVENFLKLVDPIAAVSGSGRPDPLATIANKFTSELRKKVIQVQRDLAATFRSGDGARIEEDRAVKLFILRHDGRRALGNIFADLIEDEVDNDTMLANAYKRVSTEAKQSDGGTYASPRAPSSFHYAVARGCLWYRRVITIAL